MLDQGKSSWLEKKKKRKREKTLKISNFKNMVMDKT